MFEQAISNGLTIIWTTIGTGLYHSFHTVTNSCFLLITGDGLFDFWARTEEGVWANWKPTLNYGRLRLLFLFLLLLFQSVELLKWNSNRKQICRNPNPLPPLLRLFVWQLMVDGVSGSPSSLLLPRAHDGWRGLESGAERSRRSDGISNWLFI